MKGFVLPAAHGGMRGRYNILAVKYIRFASNKSAVDFKGDCYRKQTWSGCALRKWQIKSTRLAIISNNNGAIWNAFVFLIANLNNVILIRPSALLQKWKVWSVIGGRCRARTRLFRPSQVCCNADYSIPYVICNAERLADHPGGSNSSPVMVHTDRQVQRAHARDLR